MSVCPNCGSQQPDRAAFCDECGTKLAKITTPAVEPPVKALYDNCGTGSGAAAAPASPPPAATPASPPLAAIPAPAQTPPPYGEKQGGDVLTCPNCGAQLEPDSNFCDMCGAPVRPESPPVPSPTPKPAPPPIAAPVPPVAPIPSPAYPVVATVQGCLVVQGLNVTLPFPPGKTEIFVGREDSINNIFPDVDLTDLGGDEGGVSRRHARIFVQGAQVFIEDLNSTNHTYVNQQRLTPGQAQALNSGDEVWLGWMKLNFYAQCR